MIQRTIPLLALLWLVGCQDDEIRQYKVDKPPAVAAPDIKTVNGRTLGAIIPDGDTSWFFKFQGRKELVDEQAEAFDNLIHSVRLTGNADKPIAWTLPDGWKEEPASEFRYATLRPKDGGLAVSVSRFGGSLLDNVNRWRTEHVGVRKVTADELDKETKRLNVNGVAVTIVDVTGPLAPKRGPMGMGR